MTAADRFAGHALDTKFTDLPTAVVEKAKIFVLDSLGVGIAGSSVEGGDGLMRDEMKIIHRRNMKPYSSGSVVNSSG